MDCEKEIELTDRCFSNHADTVSDVCMQCTAWNSIAGIIVGTLCLIVVHAIFKKTAPYLRDWWHEGREAEIVAGFFAAMILAAIGIIIIVSHVPEFP